MFQARLQQAALLYRESFSSKVLVVGGNEPGDRTTEAEAGQAWLISQGLPSTDVFAEPTGSDTLQSLQAAANFMKARSLHTAFLVSDPWHNARLDAMGSDLGIEAHPSATWTSADTSVITRGKEYVRETFAYLYYRLFGGS